MVAEEEENEPMEEFEKVEHDDFRDFSSDTPHMITQNDLNALIRDLNLSKDKAEILASRLKQWNLLEKNTKITSYRHRTSQNFS